MANKKLVLLIVFIIFGFKISFAFDAETTHPKLTEEAVKFYNFYAKRKINPKELEWLKEGSKNEDFSPRWANHFYDPIHNIAINKKYFKGYIPKAGWNFIFGFVLPADPLKSIDWALNQEYQFIYYKLNRTFQKAIVSYFKNDYETAFKALGHVLHLLQDLGVPEHARGDPHIGRKIDPPSYFEDYAKNYLFSISLNIAEELYKEQITYKKFYDIYEIFNELAQFTANNWFSEDTINNDFPLPKIKYRVHLPGGYLYYGYNDLPLFFEDPSSNFKTTNHKIVTKTYNDSILYKVVPYSASLIDKYFEKIEEIEKNPLLLSSYIYEIEDKNWFVGLLNQPLKLLLVIKGRIITTLWGNGEKLSKINFPSLSTLINSLKHPIITPPGKYVFNIANIYNLINSNNKQNIQQTNENAKETETTYFEKIISKSYDNLQNNQPINNLNLSENIKTEEVVNLNTEIKPTNTTPTLETENNKEKEEDNKEKLEEQKIVRGGGGYSYKDKCDEYKNKSYPKLIISEIQIETKENKDDEFIEIYNPNNQEVDITCWELEKYSSLSNPTDTPSSQILLPQTKSSGVIKPYSFYLIASKNYTGTITPDYIYAESYYISKNNSLVLKKPNGGISDIVGFGDNKDKIYKFEKNTFLFETLENKSLQRINYQDTDDNAQNFWLHKPNPKNSNFQEKPREDFIALDKVDISNFKVNVTSTEENIYLNINFKEPSSSLSTQNYLYEMLISTSSGFQNNLDLKEFGIPTPTLIAKLNGEDRNEIIEINKCPFNAEFYFGLRLKDLLDEENLSKIWYATFTLPTYFCEEENTQTNAKILISEIFVREGTSSNEYIELYNPNDFEISLNKWNLIKVNREGKEEYLFSTSTRSKYKLKGKIKPYGYFLIANSNNNLEKEFNISSDAIYSKDKDFAKNNKIKLINPINEIVDIVEWRDFNDKLILIRKAGIESTKESMKNEEKNFGNSYDNEENLEEFIEFDENEPQNSTSLPEIPPDYLTAVNFKTDKQNIILEFRSPYRKLDNAFYEIRKENNEKIEIKLPEVKNFGKKEIIEFNGCYFDLENGKKIIFNLLVNNETKNQYDLEIKNLNCAIYNADGNENMSWGSPSPTMVTKIAQEIKIYKESYMKRVKIKLSKIEKMEDDYVWLKIYSSKDGKPETGDLIYSTKISEQLIPKNFNPDWTEFNFDKKIKLDPGTYFFVFEREKLDEKIIYFSSKAKYWPSKENKHWHFLPIEGGWKYYIHPFQNTYETLAIIIE